MTLADRMAVFMAGEIQQIGRPADVFAQPNSIDVAAFIGSPPMNLIPARYRDGSVEIAGRRLETSLKKSGERDVVVGIRPGAIRVPAGGIPATVELVEDLGDTAILDLDCSGISIRARVSDGDVPGEGAALSITARAADIHLFDKTTRRRL